MRVNRRFLYWGVFLVALGGVLVAVDLANPDGSAIAEALRFWPLAVIAVGLGLVLRRTPLALAGGMLAAAVPGLVLGGAFAVAPRFAVDCGASGVPAATTTRDGTFTGSARIDIATGCGVLVVDTAAGNAWRFDASDSATRSPVIDATQGSLSIDAGGGRDWHVFDRTHDTWHLTLPTSTIDDLALAVNAGTGRISLAGARVSNLGLTANAASTTVDLGDADVARISGELNAGAESIHLSAIADLVASFDVNAGSLEICAPSGLGLIVRHEGALSGVRINGDNHVGQTWQSPDYASASHHADITITANLGSAEINPIGGCK